MRKQEADITPRVNRWVQSWIPESAAWDVKHTRGEQRFDLREIKTHQMDYLLSAATDHGFVFKIEDAGYRHPPCDTVLYKKAAWCGFAIVYPDFTCYILAGVLNLISDPSVSADRAKDIAVRVVANKDLPK